MAIRSTCILKSSNTKVNLTVFSREAFYAAMITRQHRVSAIEQNPWATVHVMNNQDEIGEQPPSVVPCNINHLASLTLCFDDTTDPSGEAIAFNEVHFRRVLGFFRHIEDTCRLLQPGEIDLDIHCSAGQSRSTALAVAFHRLFKDASHGESDYFSKGHPNPLVLSYFNQYIYAHYT